MPPVGVGLRGRRWMRDVPGESGGSSLPGGLVGAAGCALSAGWREAGGVGATAAVMGSAISDLLVLREGIFSGSWFSLPSSSFSSLPCGWVRAWISRRASMWTWV